MDTQRPKLRLIANDGAMIEAGPSRDASARSEGDAEVRLRDMLERFRDELEVGCQLRAEVSLVIARLERRAAV